MMTVFDYHTTHKPKRIVFTKCNPLNKRLSALPSALSPPDLEPNLRFDPQSGADFFWRFCWFLVTSTLPLIIIEVKNGSL